MIGRKKTFKPNRALFVPDKICVICLQSLTEAQIDMCTTKCNHSFCTSCLIKSMKFGNQCSLCRTVLTSPNQKFGMKYNKSKNIVNQEINYYDPYIQESLYYVMNNIEYHCQGGTLTEGIKHSLAREMREVFENFGMGICLNVNKTFEDVNIYQSNNVEQSNLVEQPDSPPNSPPLSPPVNIPSPPSAPPSIINTGFDVEAYHQRTTSTSAPTNPSPLASLLVSESLPPI